MGDTMKIKVSSEFNNVIQHAEQFYKILNEAGIDEIATQFNDIVNTAKSQEFVIGVVGSAKRGKSTLINGILGRTDDTIAPIGKFPVTNVVSLFKYSEKESIKVYFIDQNEPLDISEDEIRLYVCEDHNPQNEKRVKYIEVESNFPGLEENVYIVDTPGADNAVSEMHGQLLLNFLPKADAVIFLVTASEPLVQSEVDLLKNIQKQYISKIFFAINKIDSVDKEELSQAIEHNRKILNDLGFTGVKIHTISAKNYLEKKSDRGTEELIKSIRDTIQNERIKILTERINERIAYLLNQAKTELQSKLAASMATDEDIRKEIKQLEKFRYELDTKRVNREKQFIDDWNSAFSELEDKIISIRKELKNSYSEKVEKTNMFKINALARSIHGEIAANFQKKLTDAINKCEKKIQDSQINFIESVQNILISINPEIKSSVNIKSGISSQFKIGAATVPGLAVGALFSSLPGIISSALAGIAPQVTAAVWYNPFKWISYAATSIANAAVSSGSAVVTSFLSAVATPVALVAFSYGIYRGFTTLKEQKNLDRNKLILAVNKMIDEGCESVLEQINSYKRKINEILKSMNDMIEKKIDETEQYLKGLLNNRPSPEMINRLQVSLENLNKQINILASPKDDTVSEKGVSTAPKSDKFFS